MFSLRDLRFVLCSYRLDVLRAQRIIFISFFILHVVTHKSMRKENPITWVYHMNPGISGFVHKPVLWMTKNQQNQLWHEEDNIPQILLA